MSVLSSAKATGRELLGLLVDDWLLFFGTVAALCGAAITAATVSGSKAAAGFVLFAGIWIALLASLVRSATAHRKALALEAQVPDKEPAA